MLESIGRGDRIRTCDFYVPNVALYQAELHPEGAAYSSGERPIRQAWMTASIGNPTQTPDQG